MTAPRTSRRALLKGAAMLTAVPVAVSAGGVPLFDIIGEMGAAPAPAPVGFDLSTADGRILAAAEWLGLPPPPLTYDEDDPRGGCLLTEELFAWFKETDLSPHLCWIFNGDSMGATDEEQRRRLLQGREFLELLRGLDATEQELLVESAERFADRSAPMEEIAAAYRGKLDAHRAAKREAA